MGQEAPSGNRQTVVTHGQQAASHGSGHPLRRLWQAGGCNGQKLTAGQVQNRSMPRAGEASERRQLRVGRQMCWRSSEQGWTGKLAGAFQHGWPNACQQGCGSRSASSETLWGNLACSWHISDHLCSPKSSSGRDLRRLFKEAVGSSLWARVCSCWPVCDMAALLGD